MKPARITSLLLALLIVLSLALGSTVAASPVHQDCNCSDENRTLRLQTPIMQGDDVVELQAILQDLGFYEGDDHGRYDQVTTDAVKRFQEWAELEANGVFCSKTQSALSLCLAERSLGAERLTPPPGELRLVIDVDKRTLTVLVDDRPFKTFPCAVGKTSTKSPVGEWAVVHKGTNWGGGFGTRWMGLNVPWGIYGIHGTNKPGSIGTSASAGCIRMHNRDVEQLYPWVKVGTRVSIVGTYPRIRVTSPLHKGQTGKAVQQLQLSLREVGFSPGFTDGRYGNDTENSIKALQSHFGLRPTGQADLNVLTLLDLR